MVLPWARISTALAGWPQHGVKDWVPAKVRSVLLSLALALLVPAAAQASPSVTTAQFGMDVPTTAGGARAASGSGFVTPPLRAPRRYDLVGAEWRSGSGALWLRGRRSGGHWSSWARLGESEEPSRAAPHATEPVWAGGGDHVQLRGPRPMRGPPLSLPNATLPP